ncbi:MAG: ABC transporter permease [Halothiobacillaceae bacterium]|nr:ABC transporter permease [Halothiobacillaceae bacterium]
MTPREQFNAFNTLLTKEILRFSRIWVQTILPPMITTALYFVIFGELIGARIGEVEGFRYMDYIVPGLILMTVITQSYANVVSSFYGAKFQRHIEELMVSPMPVGLIIAGFVAGGVARGLIVGLAVMLVAAFFADLALHSLFLLLAVALLTAMLFSLGGLINAVFANSFDDVSIVPTFVLTPLTYLGGVFYSVSMLPGFWQQISLVNPVLYIVNGFRYAMLGVSDVSIGASLGLLSLGVMGLFLWAHYLLRSGRGLRG